jgi:predicted RNA-binding Zn-ribbon protein involved in translation (DUF1610 family)
MADDNPTTQDVHCANCGQVIVPADRMKSLVQWQGGAHDDLLVPHVHPLVIVNADLICPNCGHMVYFRLNEQKLNRLIRNISHV